MKITEAEALALTNKAPLPVVNVVEIHDYREALIIKHFRNMDERGKTTLLRMATSMPCGKECG